MCEEHAFIICHNLTRVQWFCMSNLSSVSQLLEPEDHIPIQDMSWLIFTQPCVIIKGYI